jgi:hypothetical protein
MTTDGICLPCDEQECDTCHNLLWAAGCQCPHTTWPQPLCGIQGQETNHGQPGRRWVCELDALPRHRTHEGRYWFDPDPDCYAVRWWGWARMPQRWTRRRVVASEGRFDPYDPTTPVGTDLVRGAA